jgi:hypothetical protein
VLNIIHLRAQHRRHVHRAFGIGVYSLVTKGGMVLSTSSRGKR